MNTGVTRQFPRQTGLVAIMFTRFWFKMFGTMGFTAVFFVAYIYLLRHPNAQVAIIPATALDHAIPFQPWALPIYLSLWAYVSLPAVLMLDRREIIGYGFKVALPCLAGLAVFYFWPNAILPAEIDWNRYPGVAFLKNIDTAGNAFPSLHVAIAVFSALWLHWRIRLLDLGRSMEWLNIAWCIAIAYSTLAIKQHVVFDVLSGTLLGLGTAWLTRLKAHACHGQTSRS